MLVERVILLWSQEGSDLARPDPVAPGDWRPLNLALIGNRERATGRRLHFFGVTGTKLVDAINRQDEDVASKPTHQYVHDALCSDADCASRYDKRHGNERTA
jgi:hypothetical protein